MIYTERQGKLIVNNIEKVFKQRDISVLSRQAYTFIIQYMAFIAHYNLGQFQSFYADLRLLTSELQTSEYSDDPDYNLDWADELERREERGDTGTQGADKAEIIRQIVAIARQYEEEIEQDFAERERQLDLAEVKRLLEKHGVEVTT